MIEELLNSEESDLQGWDSEVIQNYPQRYRREFFLRILRAEILVEREKSKRDGDEGLDDASAGDGSSQYMTEEEAERTRKSEDRYIKRKQETQYHLITEARQMVGKRLDILDKDTGKWRTVKVINCLVNWVDNGQRVLIQHTLQEVNKYNEDVGKEFMVDLKLLHSVESPIQEVDKEAVAKLLEFRVSLGLLTNVKVLVLLSMICMLIVTVYDVCYVRLGRKDCKVLMKRQPCPSKRKRRNIRRSTTKVLLL